MDPPRRLSLTRRRRMPWTSSPRRGSISRAYSRTTAECSGPVEHQHYTARFMAAVVVDGAWDSGGAGRLQAGAERRPLKLRAMMYRFAGATCAASCRTVCACSWGGRRRPADAAFATSVVTCRAARACFWAAAVKAFGADAASCRAARACSLGRRRAVRVDAACAECATSCRAAGVACSWGGCSLPVGADAAYTACTTSCRVASSYYWGGGRRGGWRRRHMCGARLKLPCSRRRRRIRRARLKLPAPPLAKWEQGRK